MAPKKTVEQKRDFSDRHFEYAKVIINLIKEGKRDMAESYIEDLLKVCKQTSSKAFHHSMIHACSKMGNPAAAIWCALRMVRTGLKPNIVTFNALLDTAAKSGDVDLATRLWDLMGSTGLSPNSITYNTMMNAFAKANDARLAEQWLQKMRADGMPTCAVSFQTVIAAYAKRGEYEKAEMWFRTMEESGVKPDRAIFNSMIWAKSSHPMHVERWLLEMEKSGLVPDDKAYMTLVNLWAKSGSPDRAKLWMRKMEQQGVQANKHTAAAVLDSCLRQGDAAFAKELAEKMAGRGMPADLSVQRSDSNTPTTALDCGGFSMQSSRSGSICGTPPGLAAPAPKQAPGMYVQPFFNAPYNQSAVPYEAGPCHVFPQQEALPPQRCPLTPTRGLPQRQPVVGDRQTFPVDFVFMSL